MYGSISTEDVIVVVGVKGFELVSPVAVTAVSSSTAPEVVSSV